MQTPRKRTKGPIVLAQHPTIWGLRNPNPRDHIQEVIMKRTTLVLLAGIAVTMPTIVQAQVAGSTLLGVSYGELRDVTLGWSAKRQILGHPVYNNMDERIGAVEDIIVTTDKSVSYAIINAGGFLAVAKHNVAIPVSQFQLSGEKLVLPGATKDALKATPAFEYAN
jgi:sporulation protein YlmC with PRC-barrel domain